MDDPNITMEEYIRLEEEKTRRRGKVYNWETATYGKIWDNEDVHDLRSVETEFPTIALNDEVSSKTLSCEPTVSSLNNDEIDFRISFNESDHEDCTTYQGNPYGDAFTRLIKKVKKLEKTVKTSQARRRSRVVISDDDEERRRAFSTSSGEISTAGASMLVSTASMVQEASTPSSVATKDKGKAIMQDFESPKKMKQREQIQISRDEEVALKLQEEFDVVERQRIARVHEEASSFNIEEWEDIQATIKADEELAQRIQAEEREKYSEAEKARLLAELINQRKKYFA
ncbi:hypothetical protein Tco_1165585 [Tanacetum coccineum]